MQASWIAQPHRNPGARNVPRSGMLPTVLRNRWATRSTAENTQRSYSAVSPVARAACAKATPLVESPGWARVPTAPVRRRASRCAAVRPGHGGNRCGRTRRPTALLHGCRSPVPGLSASTAQAKLRAGNSAATSNGSGIGRRGGGDRRATGCGWRAGRRRAGDLGPHPTESVGRHFVVDMPDFVAAAPRRHFVVEIGTPARVSVQP